MFKPIQAALTILDGDQITRDTGSQIDLSFEGVTYTVWTLSGGKLGISAIPSNEDGDEGKTMVVRPSAPGVIRIEFA